MQNEPIITLPETADRDWLLKSGLLRKKTSDLLVLDFSQTTRIDSAVLCALKIMHGDYKSKKGRLVLRNISPQLLSSLETTAIKAANPSDTAIPTTDLFIKLGAGFTAGKDTIVSALSVLTEMLYWGTIGVLKRQDFRKGCLGEQMYQLGYKAFGIVGLLSFLIGMVLALQAAIQLKSYGAGIFLGPLIGLTMVKEMGPLLTAIILAGRTGSATTAEIGTMVVGEELDALRTMGINPVQFIVVPKFWAISITMPLLSMLATVSGIVGGYSVGALYLNLAPDVYFRELFAVLVFRDVLIGFAKSVVFSWLIICIGSFYGFKVRGGAESVGRETTASVVACIFIIIIADALFSFVL
jgi:phospholipid/cholesterol/gamma-HCH transport system permease protein